MPKEKKEEANPENTKSHAIWNVGQDEIGRRFDDIFQSFRKSFDDLMGPILPEYEHHMTSHQAHERFAPIDLVDTGDSYTVTAEFPGFTKDMVDVEVNEEMVTIIAKAEEKKEDTGKNYLRRERSLSSMKRSVAFPEKIAPSKSEGTMKNGILELKLPKKQPKPEAKFQKVSIS